MKGKGLLTMNIITAQKSETAEYSAYELKKYITELSRGAIVPKLHFVDVLPETIQEDCVVLATLEELSLDTSDLTDPFIEDILDINIENLTGYIAGSNQRSILMGVYKYCTSAGCRFIRPGENGDYVPHADLYHHSFQYRKKADYPFRGQCVEGAVSYEHIRDTVYWLPKIGMNMYMIEGLVPYAYMNKWYSHIGNSILRSASQAADYQMMEEYTDLLEKDISKTGLQFHSLGHAWMFEPLGLHTGDPAGEEAAKNALTEEQKRHLALVKGKRGIMHNSTFFTHFCYSNPDTRKLLVDYMVDYIQKKPHVDFVHMWLADSTNNHCECEECAKMHPSDYYVMMLNELDDELTKIGSEARVVLIMYSETQRPPQKLKLNHPKRFVLLSAIMVNYGKGYLIDEYTGEVPEFKRNQYYKPSNALSFKWHKEWKKICGNVHSITFEYRFYKDMYCDLGHMQISRETYRDMKNLENAAYQGCMNDQTHRMYMPTSLPIIAMGETLFDKDVDYEKMTNEYFEGAFGPEWKACREYLEKLSELLCPSNFRVGGGAGVQETALATAETGDISWVNNPHVAACAAKIPPLIDDFASTIIRNLTSSISLSQLTSWNYLRYHAEICKLFSKILLAGARDGIDAAIERYDNLKQYLCEHELEFHNAFDVYLYLRALVQKLNIPSPELWK